MHEIDELQKAADLWVTTLSDTKQAQELVYWTEVAVLARRIRLNFLMKFLVFIMVNTF